MSDAGAGSLLDRARTRWRGAPLHLQALLVALVPIVTLLLTAGSAVLLERQERESEAAVSRAYQGRQNVFVVYVALLNAEAGVRGYLLTRDETALEPFRMAERAAPSAMQRLGEFATTPERKALTGRLHTLINRRLAQWNDVLALSASEGADVSSALESGKGTMSEIRETLVEMLSVEARDLAARSATRERLLTRNHWIIGLSVIGGVGGGVLLAWLFVAGVVGRVERIEADARLLARGTPLQRPEHPSHDAIGRLGEAIHGASRLLIERERELRQSAEAIAVLNAELELRLAAQAALNQELEAFSYSVSHDLRSPLRSIDGFAQALTEDCEAELSDAGRQHLARVRAAAQRMGQLIDDMLTLSRVTRADMRRVPVDISALASGIAAAYKEEAGTRSVEWRIEPGLRAVGDRPLLQTALDNLLGNAWKFTSKASHAIIAVESIPAPEGQMGFAVRDNGAGFDMQYAGKLFGVFQRLHSALEFPGTGVGLATVERIIVKHGGRVWAEGTVDAGASFYVVLPAASGEVYVEDDRGAD